MFSSSEKLLKFTVFTNCFHSSKLFFFFLNFLLCNFLVQLTIHFNFMTIILKFLLPSLECIQFILTTLFSHNFNNFSYENFSSSSTISHHVLLFFFCMKEDNKLKCYYKSKHCACVTVIYACAINFPNNLIFKLYDFIFSSFF